MRSALPIVLSVLFVACAGDSVAPRPLSVPDNLGPLGSVGVSKTPDNGGLVVWGDNTAQQISAAPVGEDISEIATGGAKQGLVIRDDGSLVLWGGVGVSGAVPPLPDSLAAGRYIDAHLSLSYLFAIRRDHSVMTWGSFLNKGLGGSPANPPANLRATDIAGGSDHGVALAMDGRLATWGSGPAAVPPPEDKFSEVAARTIYSIALRKDGTLFGWGNVPTSTPGIYYDWVSGGWESDGAGHFFIPNDRFVTIAAGNRHILALRANGTIAGWGQGPFGETRAPAGIRFTAISGGLGFSIGLDTDGAIHQWGDASKGTGNVPGGRFVSIRAGASHGAALRLADKVR